MHDSKALTNPDRAPRRPLSRRWTAQEITWLRQAAWTMTAAEIAARLDRTVLAVRTKAAHERIRLRTGADPSAPAGE